jgi:hypothetical protein
VKNYVALSAPGSFFNVLPLWPRKNYVPARLDVSDAEKWVQRLAEADIDSELKKGRVIARLRDGELERHEDLLRELIHQTVKEGQQ